MGPTYDILIKYSTGDSSGIHDTESTLAGKWNDLSIVEENLDRIKAHYLWVQDYWKKTPMPEFMNEITNGADREYSIPLKLDNGSIWQIRAFWTGHFESLISVEVIPNYRKIEF